MPFQLYCLLILAIVFAIPKCPANMWSWFSIKISLTFIRGTINRLLTSIISPFSLKLYLFVFS